MDDISVIRILIACGICIFLQTFMNIFVHERIHLYTLRFFGGDGYIGRYKGNPAVFHTTTLTNHNQRIIVCLAPIPSDLIIHFIGFYIFISSIFGATQNIILLCIGISIFVSISEESSDIKTALRIMKLKKGGIPLHIPDGTKVSKK